MPAQRCNAVGNLQQFVLGCEVHQALDEVKAHAAHASGMQAFEFGVAHIALERDDAARAALGALQRIDQRAVVCAVAGCLHDHVARKAQAVAQRKQMLG